MMRKLQALLAREKVVDEVGTKHLDIERLSREPRQPEMAARETASEVRGDGLRRLPRRESLAQDVDWFG